MQTCSRLLAPTQAARAERRLSARPRARALLLVALALACEEFGPRVYTAAPYRAAAGCLEPYAPLGLVQARGLGALCEPVCLRQGDALYVSTVCPPYPAAASLEPPDAGACFSALEALNAAAYCDMTGPADAAP